MVLLHEELKSYPSKRVTSARANATNPNSRKTFIVAQCSWGRILATLIVPVPASVPQS